MPIVVADTGPLRYLVPIDAVDLLPRMFDKILIPDIVRFELNHARTPAAVSAWMSTCPAWLEQHPTPPLSALPFPRLGTGPPTPVPMAMTLADLAPYHVRLTHMIGSFKLAISASLFIAPLYRHGPAGGMCGRIKYGLEVSYRSRRCGCGDLGVGVHNRDLDLNARRASHSR